MRLSFADVQGSLAVIFKQSCQRPDATAFTIIVKPIKDSTGLAIKPR